MIPSARSLLQGVRVYAWECVVFFLRAPFRRRPSLAQAVEAAHRGQLPIVERFCAGLVDHPISRGRLEHVLLQFLRAPEPHVGVLELLLKNRGSGFLDPAVLSMAVLHEPAVLDRVYPHFHRFDASWEDRATPPLYHAFQNGSDHAVSLLLADTDVDACQAAPFRYSAQFGRFSWFPALVATSKNPQAAFHHALCAAASKGSVRGVQTVLDWMATDADRTDALSAAAQAGKKDAFDLLVRGADPQSAVRRLLAAPIPVWWAIEAAAARLTHDAFLGVTNDLRPFWQHLPHCASRFRALADARSLTDALPTPSAAAEEECSTSPVPRDRPRF